MIGQRAGVPGGRRFGRFCGVCAAVVFSVGMIAGCGGSTGLLNPLPQPNPAPNAQPNPSPGATTLQVTADLSTDRGDASSATDDFPPLNQVSFVGPSEGFPGQSAVFLRDSAGVIYGFNAYMQQGGTSLRAGGTISAPRLGFWIRLQSTQPLQIGDTFGLQRRAGFDVADETGSATWPVLDVLQHGSGAILIEEITPNKLRLRLNDVYLASPVGFNNRVRVNGTLIFTESPTVPAS